MRYADCAVCVNKWSKPTCLHLRMEKITKSPGTADNQTRAGTGSKHCGEAPGEMPSQQVVDEDTQIIWTKVFVNKHVMGRKRKTSRVFLVHKYVCSQCSQIQMFLLYCSQLYYKANLKPKVFNKVLTDI